MANNSYNPYGGWQNNGWFYPPTNSAPYMYPQTATLQQNNNQAITGQQSQTQQATQGSSPQFAFVSGVDNAKSYLQFSANAVLLDDDANVVYLKKTGADQKSEIKCFSLQEIDMPKPITSADTSKYVLKEDFDKFTSKIDNLINTFAPQFLGQSEKKQAADNSEKMPAKEASL